MTLSEYGADFRFPGCRVLIDGQEVVDRLSVRCSFGFDQRVSECEIHVTVLPPWVRHWSRVQVLMGSSVATMGSKFFGYVVGFNKELYPREVTINCKGPLIKAQLTEAPVSDEDLEDPEFEGIAMAGQDTDGDGRTDRVMVEDILNRCGLGEFFVGGGGDYATIGGTGRSFGTIADTEFWWKPGQSALDFIDELDKVCLGYRTFESLGGMIYRVPVSVAPGPNFSYAFTEGVDIEKATTEEGTLEAVNRVIVVGFDDGLGLGPQRFMITGPRTDYMVPGVPVSTYEFSSSLIEREREDEPGAGLSCEVVANWLLGEYNRVRITASFSTPKDVELGPGQTIQINSPTRLGHNRKFWLQHLDVEYTTSGEFTQSVQAIGGTGAGSGPDGELMPGDPGYVEPLHPGGNNPPIASFTLVVEEELIATGGDESRLYLIYAESAAYSPNSQVASLAWSLPGGDPSSLTESGAPLNKRFVGTVSDLTGKVLTLVVTDSLGLQQTISREIPDTGTTIERVSRPLYAGSRAVWEVFDGSTWRTAGVTGGADIDIVTNGPIAAAGSRVLTTTDFLATPSVEVEPFGPYQSVTAIWQETDVGGPILAGSSEGNIAVLWPDSGGVWYVTTGPDPGWPIIKVVINRHDTVQWSVLTPNALYRTDNGGASWATEVEAESGETFHDLAIGPNANAVGMTGGRLLVDRWGNTYNFDSVDPVEGIVSVAADITEPYIYAITNDGRTLHNVLGGYGLAEGAHLPAGVEAVTRGLWRDGTIPRLLYIAGGTSGFWKSTNAFFDPNFYHQIRIPGVGSSPGDADYRSIGSDGLLVPAVVVVIPPVDPIIGTYYSVAGEGRVFYVGFFTGSEPGGYTEFFFDDSEWLLSVAADGSSAGSEVSGTQAIAPAEGPAGQLDRWIYRVWFPIAEDQVVTTATLTVKAEDFLIELYFNEAPIAGTYDPGTNVTGNQGTERVFDITAGVIVGDNLLVFTVMNGYVSGGDNPYTWVSWRVDIT